MSQRSEERKLCVCIPTFNRCRYLLELLQNFDALYRAPGFQYLRLEMAVVVCDNGSTDDTVEVCARFPWLVYHRNQSNIGATANFKKCTEIVTSQFVWLLGDDDIVVADGVINIIHYLRENQCRSDVLFIENLSAGQKTMATVLADSSIRHVGHISRLIVRQSLIRDLAAVYDGRPRYFLYPHLLWVVAAWNRGTIEVLPFDAVIHRKAPGPPRWRARQWLSDILEMPHYAACLARQDAWLGRQALADITFGVLLKDYIGFLLFGQSSGVPHADVKQSLLTNFESMGRFVLMICWPLTWPAIAAMARRLLKSLKPSLADIDLSRHP